MDPNEPELERLAILAGVQPSYDDVFGVPRIAQRKTVRALLGTMGFDAGDGAAAAADELELAAWLAEVEPVYVFEAGSAYVVTLSSAADAAGEDRSWQLSSESGATRSGTFVLRDLPVLETRLVRGRSYERRAFELDPAFGIGYYRLRVRGPHSEIATTVVIAPRACWIPERVAARGVWGLAIQLYALRSERNWGIGDFTDLATLCDVVRAAGGAAIGLNPLHAVRFDPGTAPSPYSPSSRLWTSWMYLDIERLPGFSSSDVDARALARARASDLVDYAEVVALKSSAARAAYGRFVRDGSGDRSAFAAFVAEGGDALRLVATFEALVEFFARDRPESRDWAAWPAPFRDPASAEVARFSREREHDIAFFSYLHWQIAVQLEECARSAPRPIGLYRDLAVGADVAGADSWADAATVVRDATVGAPPDILNVRGQDWGVAPFDPVALRDAAYEPFVALLRANMRFAGALRIDHVMALARLYWVPALADPTDGAYVSYPLDELLSIVALESERARCMVIGEDLGTVPPGFREKLAEKNIFSYRLLQFERDDDRFFEPAAYPARALVSLATHDLPPLASYWTASDIATRARLGLYVESERVATDTSARAADRAHLLTALAEHVGLSEQERRRFDEASARPDDRATLAEIALVANRYLARSPARLLMIQLEDALGDVDQANVPTTTHEHPNWRRRASVSLEDLPGHPNFVALARAMAEERRAVEECASDEKTQ